MVTCGDGFVVANASNVTLDEVCDDHNVNDCGLCKNGGGCTSGAAASVVTPKAATGALASAGSSSFSDGQWFTLSDGTHTLTFEFDNNNNVGPGNVLIDIGAAAPQDVMSCRICKAINGSGLNVIGSGSGCPPDCSSNTFTLTNKSAGAVGNVTMTRANNMPVTFKNGLLGMSGGAGVDCAAGIGCTSDNDCASGLCSLVQTCPGGIPCGQCNTPSCADQKKNGTETDVDCGGNCLGCAAGRACISNGDCASGLCNSTVTSSTGTGVCS
jgi:hypothetical protein